VKAASSLRLTAASSSLSRVQLGGGRVVDAELALAADSDDHYPSPSCGSAGRSAAGMLAGWAGACCAC